MVAALLLQLDPFGHAHWSGEDIAIGLACVLPLITAGTLLPITHAHYDVRTDSAVLLLDHAPRQTTETIRISKQSVQLMQLLNAVSAARKAGRDQDDRVPALLRAVAQLVASGRPLGESGALDQAQALLDKGPQAYSSARTKGPGALQTEGPGAGSVASSEEIDMFARSSTSSTVTAEQVTSAATASAASTSAPTPPTSTAAPPSLLDALLADTIAPASREQALQETYPEAAAVFARAGLDRVPWSVDGVTGEAYVERQVRCVVVVGCPVCMRTSRVLRTVVFKCMARHAMSSSCTAPPAQIVTREEGNVLRAALAAMQRETVLDDFTRHISPGLTLTYLLAAVTAQECMLRAVVLTGWWCVD